jgi:hypothetical protein
LEQQVSAGGRHNTLMEGALRRLLNATAPPEETAPLPTQLTARARRLIERGRELLAGLRALAAEPLLQQDENGPLAVLYRETTAMTDSALRMVQALPDAPSGQLRLCEGIEVILAVVADRIAALTAAVGRLRREHAWIDTLADLLVGLDAGQTPDVRPFAVLAEAILDDARQGAPLRFLDAGPGQPARAVACHSLVVAQVVARLVREDPDWSGQPVEPVLAALVHDAGMLRVPAEVLAHPGPLDDARRRAVEAHTRHGAELAARLLPNAGWLAEAALGHHERQDGTGYPAGLREAQIPPLNRLLAVCDVYAALCSPRPHRPARETRTALADTLLLAEKGALDRYQAERLLALSFYPVGSVVELADGAVGLVVATHTGRRSLELPARPVLDLLTDAQGQPLPSPRPLDLAGCEGHSIVRSLSAAERRRLLGKRHPELV